VLKVWLSNLNSCVAHLYCFTETPQQRFIRLLDSPHQVPDDVLMSIWRSFPNELGALSTKEQAEELLKKGFAVLHTSTKNLLRTRGIEVDGPFHARSTKADFTYAFDNGIPILLKFYRDAKQTTAEFDLLRRITNPAENNLVPIALVSVDQKASSASQKEAKALKGMVKSTKPLHLETKTVQGLRMPVYIHSLEAYPEPMSGQVALRLLNQMLRAIRHLHSEGIKLSHCDIKPGNIFIDEVLSRVSIVTLHTLCLVCRQATGILVTSEVWSSSTQ